MTTKTIPHDQIVKDDRYYPRITPSWFRIHEYTESMRAGAKFPSPLVAFDDESKNYVLLDGWHTTQADKRCGNKAIACEVSAEPRARWLEIATQRNSGHGHRLSVQDKVRVIDLLRKQNYSWARIGALMYIPAPSVKRIVGGRVMERKGSGLRPVYVKGAFANVSAGADADAVESAQEMIAAHDQVQVIESALALFSHGMVDATDDRVVTAALALAEAATAWAAVHGAKGGAKKKAS